MGKIKANVASIIDQGGTEADVNAYLAHEGVTADQLRNSPAAAPGQINGATPVASAYNPTMAQRMSDLARARMTGTKAPALPDDAPIWQRAMNWLDTFNRGGDVLAHGMTAGFTDEAAGLGSGLAAVLPGSRNPGTFTEGYKRGADAENQNIANFKSDNPTIGNALETIGLITSPLMRVGQGWQQQAPTLIGRAARTAAVGAGQGALTGAGYSEGDIGDRALSAALGAGVGGLTAGALAPAIDTGTRAGQTFSQVLAARRAAAADPMERARQMVAAAIARDQMTPVPAQGEALVSAGGPNMQALGRQATVAPGNARAVAAQYFADAAGDMPDAIGQAAQTNVSSSRLLPTLEALDRQQAAAARPAYEAFYSLSPDAFDTPYFRNLMGGGIGKKLIQKAYDIAEIDRAAGRIPDNPMQYLLDAEGNVSLNQAPTPQAVDMMKRAVDQMVADNTDALGKVRGAEGNSWERLRRSLISNADQASTVDGTSLYKAARDAYAGPAQLKDAARMGSQALSSKGLTSEKAQAFADLSPSEQDAFRTGLAEAIIEKAGQMGPNTDPVQLFLKGRNAQDLMRTYLGNQDAFDSFVRTLQQQSRIVKASRAVMGGSPTAPRLAENADAAAQEQQLTDQLSMARDAWNVATGQGGGRVAAAMRIGARARNSVSGVSEPVADELGRMLFNPDAAQNRALMQSLGPRVPQLQAQTAQQQALQRYLATFGTLPAAPAGAFIGSH
jgi:hypothetical protein